MCGRIWKSWISSQHDILNEYNLLLWQILSWFVVKGFEKVAFQVNMTFWFWAMYPPPSKMKISEILAQWCALVAKDGKVVNCMKLEIPNEYDPHSGEKPPKWLKLANFAWFATFPIFWHQSGLEWLGTANFIWSATFPIFSHWSGPQWLRMANFTQFTTFLIFSH